MLGLLGIYYVIVIPLTRGGGGAEGGEGYVLDVRSTGYLFCHSADTRPIEVRKTIARMKS